MLREQCFTSIGRHLKEEEMKIKLKDSFYLPEGEYRCKIVGKIRSPSGDLRVKYEVTAGKHKGARFLLDREVGKE